MATAFISLLAALLPLAGKALDAIFSPERITARQLAEADHVSQDFKQALGNNDAISIDGACADLHDRVRAALRGC